MKLRTEWETNLAKSNVGHDCPAQTGGELDPRIATGRENRKMGTMTREFYQIQRFDSLMRGFVSSWTVFFRIQHRWNDIILAFTVADDPPK
jgi:hypothetical protein